MLDHEPIRQNTLFSRPTIEHLDADPDALMVSRQAKEAGKGIAINCTQDPGHTVERYVQAGIAPATRRAYHSDAAQYRAWGGHLPATDTEVAAYLAAHAPTLKVATLTRRLAALSVAHELAGLPNPVRSPLIRATMRGIRREHGSAQRQAKPILRDDLFAVLDATGDGVKAARDRALLMIGFAGGFRRSELVGLDCADIERVRQGIVITLRRSKTDQIGEGRKIAVPFGRTRWCPVTALDRWLSTAGIEDGPVFRRVNRHGGVLADRLSGEAVCLVVRERVAAAGYDPSAYSGHSLRAGLATSAAQFGVPTFKIRAQTGHKTDQTLGRYIRDGQLFDQNAAGALL